MCVSVRLLLEREGEVILTGLTVSHQVTGLFTQPQQRLGVSPANRSVIPAVNERRVRERALHLNKHSESDVPNSQLALQRHGGVDALAHARAARVQRAHLSVDQAAAGVSLKRTRLQIFSGRHPGLFHAVKLHCNRRETANIIIECSSSRKLLQRRWFWEYFSVYFHLLSL